MHIFPRIIRLRNSRSRNLFLRLNIIIELKFFLYNFYRIWQQLPRGYRDLWIIYLKIIRRL